MNRWGASDSDSGRVQWYCGGKNVLGFDCTEMLENQGIIGTGYAMGTQQQTASILYTKRTFTWRSDSDGIRISTRKR